DHGVMLLALIEPVGFWCLTTSLALQRVMRSDRYDPSGGDGRAAGNRGKPPRTRRGPVRLILRERLAGHVMVRMMWSTVKFSKVNPGIQTSAGPARQHAGRGGTVGRPRRRERSAKTP